MASWDDVSGEQHDIDECRQARKTERDFVASMNAYTRCKISCVEGDGGKLIDVKWIGVNKGDAAHHANISESRFRCVCLLHCSRFCLPTGLVCSFRRSWSGSRHIGHLRHFVDRFGRIGVRHGRSAFIAPRAAFARSV